MKFKKAIERYKNLIYPLISLAVLVSLWAVLAAIIGKELLMPSVGSVCKELMLLLGEKEFWAGAGGTLLRVLLSFAASLVCAFLFALAATFCKPIYRLLSPIVTITRSVPTMSVILIALVWFNAKNTPLFIAFLIIFPTLYSSLYSSLSSVNGDLLEMAKAYKVDKKYVIMKLYVPSVLPSFFDAVKNAISLNVKLIIAAEVLAGTRQSIGNLMQLSKMYLEVPQLIAYTILTIIMSYLLETCVIGLKKLFVRW